MDIANGYYSKLLIGYLYDQWKASMHTLAGSYDRKYLIIK